MFNNILVPTDGSDLAANAVEQALLFAKEIGAKITTVTVTEPFPSHLLAEPNRLGDTPVEYKKQAEAITTTASHQVTGMAMTVTADPATVLRVIIGPRQRPAPSAGWR